MARHETLGQDRLGKARVEERSKFPWNKKKVKVPYLSCTDLRTITKLSIVNKLEVTT